MKLKLLQLLVIVLNIIYYILKYPLKYKIFSYNIINERFKYNKYI